MKTIPSLFNLFDLRLAQLHQQRRFATERNYERTFASIRRFTCGQDVAISSVTREWVNAYNAFLGGRGVSRNTMSFYNRIFRALCNWAWNCFCGLKPVEDPFRDVYTGVAPTRKRAVSPEVLRRMSSLQLSGEMALSRDLFLFSFYARGMCFVDIAKLRRSEIAGGVICYRRSKTGEPLCLNLEPCMEEIIGRWLPLSHADYVFPLLHTTNPANVFREYSYRLDRHNQLLKKIGVMAGADAPLNSYVARHSWATIARRLDVPVSVISSGMGHSSERTTRIYLSELEHTVLDRANRKVIKAVLR